MSYQSVVLADAPIGYWRLGELTGTNADDSTANNHDGTYSGTYTLGASTVIADGDAGVTVAGAGYVTMGDVNAFEFVGAFAVEAWILIPPAAVTTGTIANKFDTSTLDGWNVRVNPTGQVTFTLRASGGGSNLFSVATGISVADGRWHHVVCTWDGTTGANKVIIYVDTAVGTTGTATGTVGQASAAKAFIVGASSDLTVFLNGSIDEVAVYSSELTATQVAAHYAESKKLTSADYTVLVNNHSTVTRWNDTEILDLLNEAPNTASVVVRGLVPVIGQTLEVRVLSTTVFKGTVTGSTQLQTRSGTRASYRLEAIDGVHLLDRRLVNYDFSGMTANSIAAQLIGSFTSGFTVANVQTGLEAVDLPNKMEKVSQALTRLGNLAGAFWYLDYTNDLHFRTVEVLGNPQPLDTTDVFQYRDLRYHRALPLATRVFVEGRGSQVSAPIGAGSAFLPVEDATVFSPIGGQAIIGSQIVSYSAVTQIQPTQALTLSDTLGTGVESGIHAYAYTFLAGAGETLPSAVRSVTLGTIVADPTTAPPATAGGSVGSLVNAATYKYKFSYAADLFNTDSILYSTIYETLPSPESAGVIASYGTAITSAAGSGDPRIGWCKIYRSTANTSSFYALGVVVLASGQGITDNIPDNSLTAFPYSGPASSSGLIFRRAALTNLGIGPSGTTARKIYRSAVGSSQLKLVTSIANNVATTYEDSLADASLGANVPVADTSGLVVTAITATTGTHAAGATTMNVGSTTDFQSTGVLLIGNMGIAVTYTGKGATTFTGIPASGAGSIPTPLPAATEIQAAFGLVGIPTSGAGSLITQVPQGESANLLVQADDTTAQTALAALEGGDGIHERFIQDRRLSQDGATARAAAEIALAKNVEDQITVISEDPFMISGRTITVNIASIVIGARIQQVRITWPHDRKLPQREVTATNVFKTLYQYLRDLDDRADNRRS